MDALIGYTGFVGSTLLKQRQFDTCYRSTDIEEISGKTFDTVLCAGAPAQKWKANSHPEADMKGLSKLMSCLKTIKCRRFVLISTVDVFKRPIGVDEQTRVDTDGLHAYGSNRRILEEFVEMQFEDSLVVRLPGLVGPGLRKNIIFDFLNKNNLESIDSRGVFQFYPMVNLWFDIEIALKARLKLLHLTAAPVSVADVARDGFGIVFSRCGAGDASLYDMRTIHGNLFAKKGELYQYSLHEALQAIRSYAQSEPIDGDVVQAK